MLVFVEWIPFVFNLGERFGLRCAGEVFFGADIGDPCLWKGAKNGLNQRVGFGLFPQGACGGVSYVGNGRRTALVDKNDRPTSPCPRLQPRAKPLRQIGRRGVRGLEFNAARLKAGQSDARFDLDQKFDIAVGADQLHDLLKGGKAGKRVRGVLHGQLC